MGVEPHAWAPPRGPRRQVGERLPAYDPRQQPSQQRASDSEREAVAAFVRDAIDSGRLQLDELDDRLGAVYEAKTHGDLGVVIDDIVPVPRPSPAPIAAPVPPIRSTSEKKILPAFLLGVPFGLFGAHRFYTGQHGTGALMIGLLFSGIGAPFVVFWWLYDLCMLACGQFEDGDGHIMRDWL